jgi:peroxisomal enoyl-CoA hydratase 2
MALYERTVYADDVEVGDTEQLVVENIQREDFVRYAGATGDFTPFHYDEPHAKEIGNPSVFAQGMLVAGYAATLVSNWFGLANVDRFRTRFQSRVWPGDDLTVAAEVTDVAPTDGGAVVDVAISITNGEDEEVISGDATVTLPEADA